MPVLKHCGMCAELINSSVLPTLATSDYIAGPVSVTFGVGDSQASAAIAIINDAVVEQLMESFGLNLSSSDNAADVSGATAQATIVDDDSKFIIFC